MKKVLLRQYGLLLFISLLLLGCSPNIDKYSQSSPKMSLESFLNGKIKGQGIIQDWKSLTRRNFTEKRKLP